MREIEWTSRFKRDYKREKKGRHSKALDYAMTVVVDLLAADEPMPEKYHDHPLIGDWWEHRDCHVKPDLVLIYRKLGDDVLQLVRMGSHSELGM